LFKMGLKATGTAGRFLLQVGGWNYFKSIILLRADGCFSNLQLSASLLKTVFLSL